MSVYLAQRPKCGDVRRGSRRHLCRFPPVPAREIDRSDS